MASEHRCAPPTGTRGQVWVCPEPGCHQHWWADTADTGDISVGVIVWRAYTEADYAFYGRVGDE